MNKILTREIINHIYSELGVITNNLVDNKKFGSIKSDNFLLEKKIISESENKKEILGSVWGMESTIVSNDLSILVGDCSIEKSVKEYASIVYLKEAPAYGMYCVYGDGVDSSPLISVTTDGKSWVPTTTYLQATFLAGMQNVKENIFNWKKCDNYDLKYDLLLSFIKHYSNFYGDFE